MALVKYGSLVTSIRGKLGGQVYQKCGKSEGVRNLGTYDIPVSERLQNQRRVITYLANWWNRLDEQTRNNINAVAHTYPAYDKHGNPVVPSGWNVFVMVNSLMWRIPSGLLLPEQEFCPPLPFQLQQSTLTVQTEHCCLDVTGETTEQTYFLLYAAQPQRANTGLKNAKYRYIGYLSRSELTTTNIYVMLRQAIPSVPGATMYGHLHGWYVPIWARCIIPFTGSWRDSNFSTLYIYNPIQH